MVNRERLIESGWKQGILLVPNDERLKENAHYDIPNDARLLIISQTCDLVQGSFDTEPYFEVLCLRPLGREPDGGYLGGKNSRRIEFRLSVSENNISHWFALPYERHLIDRNLLLDDLRPDFSIEDTQTLQMILSWLSRRYTRTAFPEAFIRRIDARKDSIGRKFSRLNPYVKSVYVQLDPFDELNDGDEYNIEIMLVMDTGKYDDPEQHKECDKIKKQLEDQLNKCAGIIVEDISLESTASVTIEDLKRYREWDYSYLSFREPNDAVLPVNV